MSVRLILFCAVLLSACGTKPAAQSESVSKDEPVKQYALHGEVLRLDAQGKIAAIKHEPIGDWMGAMTMEFPVKDQKEFASLRTGERINATVFVQGTSFWLEGIHEDTVTPTAK